MGYTLYRNRTKPSETDQEMWDSPLNSYLREHQMGHAGTHTTLPEMIRHVEAIGAIWWDYTTPAPAKLGVITAKNGGILPRSWSPLIDSREMFTTCAIETLRSWHAELATDQTRRDLYGSHHADLLVSSFSFAEFHLDKAVANCPYIDGRIRQLPANTVVAQFRIADVPNWSPPDHFGGTPHAKPETRRTTVDYFRQASAIKQGWKNAADAAPKERSTTA
ncbi:hypothetical protein [Streptomyces lydicus]|uniref:hypothetical protein n=1 Tax=Streptomyces lydicus TaxID=47763 RepID=UPI0010100CE1|nr:hypothetical protein [Streptomyces lydicus]MCZ1012043.1 hypothetical protein [Streptomyces lydicus]